MYACSRPLAPAPSCGASVDVGGGGGGGQDGGGIRGIARLMPFTNAGFFFLGFWVRGGVTLWLAAPSDSDRRIGVTVGLAGLASLPSVLSRSPTERVSVRGRGLGLGFGLGRGFTAGQELDSASEGMIPEGVPRPRAGDGDGDRAGDGDASSGGGGGGAPPVHTLTEAAGELNGRRATVGEPSTLSAVRDLGLGLGLGDGLGVITADVPSVAALRACVKLPSAASSPPPFNLCFCGTFGGGDNGSMPACVLGTGIVVLWPACCPARSPLLRESRLPAGVIASAISS